MRAHSTLRAQVYWGWVVSAVSEVCAAAAFVWCVCYCSDLWVVAQSIIVFIAVRFGMACPDSDGGTMYIFQFGSVCFSCVVSLVTLRLCFEVQEHTRLFQSMTFLSVVSWVPSALLFDASDANGMLGGMSRIFGSAAFWITLVLVLVAATIRIVAVKMWKRHFMTEFRHAVQEHELLVPSSYVAQRCAG